MEAKINFKNLANEDKEKIMSRYKELHADKGTVYAWQFDTKIHLQAVPSAARRTQRNLRR